MRRVLMMCVLLVLCAASSQAQVEGEHPFGRPGEEAQGERVRQTDPCKKKGDAWAEFACLFNASPATRETSRAINRLNEAIMRVAQYQRGLVVSAGDDEKQARDEALAAYAEVLRLLPGVLPELEREARALERVPLKKP
jgi:hypothetical protein